MKSSFIIGLVLISFFSYSQQINGIGPFKINSSTTSLIDSLRNEIYFTELFFSDNVDDKNYYDLPKIKEHRKFKIDKMAIASMNFGDIELDFLNDTLYQIVINTLPDNFDENMKIKYGQPSVSSETKKITCTSSISSYEREEKTYTSTYRKDKIEASSVFSIYYNNECEKKFFNFFMAYDAKKQSKIDMLETQKDNMNKKAKDDKKRKALGEL